MRTAPVRLNGPDLERTADGFTVRVFFTPTLSAPTTAAVFIATVDGSPVDVVIRDAHDGYDVFTHPAIYSARYADALNERSAL